MSNLPYSPTLEELVERRRLEILRQIQRIPVAALIWGPAPASASPQAEARELLRRELAKDGHLARFSEELVDLDSPHSLLLQQVAQAQAYDVVFSVPGSAGSVAEIHDFSRIPGLSQKIIAFLDEEWSDGYSSKSLVQLESTATCRIQRYSADKLPGCIVEVARDMIRRLQEFYYLVGRRN